jgi:hypothetical protein
MAVAEIILGAPRLQADDEDEFWRLLQPRKKLPCLQVAVDFGPRYKPLCSVSGGNIVFEFLVEGDFDPSSDYRLIYGTYDGRTMTVQQDTPHAMPMPILPSSTLAVRGKVVVAAMSLPLLRSFTNGWYRIGDWVMAPDLSRFAFQPKDYVMDMHLSVLPYNARPGCKCCTVMTKDESIELTLLRLERRNELTDKLLCAPYDTWMSIVEEYGDEIVARFLDPKTGPHYRPPLCTKRLKRMREVIRWRRTRGDVIRALQAKAEVQMDSGAGTKNDNGIEELALLADRRLHSKKGDKRLTSFFAGSVVLFL